MFSELYPLFTHLSVSLVPPFKCKPHEKRDLILIFSPLCPYHLLFQAYNRSSINKYLLNEWMKLPTGSFWHVQSRGVGLAQKAPEFQMKEFLTVLPFLLMAPNLSCFSLPSPVFLSWHALCLAPCLDFENRFWTVSCGSHWETRHDSPLVFGPFSGVAAPKSWARLTMSLLAWRDHHRVKWTLASNLRVSARAAQRRWGGLSGVLRTWTWDLKGAFSRPLTCAAHWLVLRSFTF